MKYRLQYLRAIAAFLVVVWHASYHLWDTRADDSVLRYTSGIMGSLGVTLFFVISGYLMATLAVKNTAGQFFLHRVIRIYPLYWIVVLLFFAGSALLGYGFTFDLASFLLLPGAGRVYPLGVEWTLPFEISFYLIIFLIMLLRVARAIPVIAACWAFAIVVLQQLIPLYHGQFPRLSLLIVSPWTLPFALGLLVPTALRYGVVSTFSWIPGLALVTLAWAFQSSAIYLLPVGCVCLVHWAVAPRAEVTDRTHEIKWLTKLGDWSFALYLCHVPIMLWMFRLAPPHWTGVALWCGSIVLSLIGAAMLGTVDLRLYRRLKGVVDGFKTTTCAKLGFGAAACLFAYSGHAEMNAWDDTRITVRADEIGREIGHSRPLSASALAAAAEKSKLVSDAALVGYADSLTCGADGTVHVRGWALDRDSGSNGVSVLVFQDGDYRGSAMARFVRADVVQALNMPRFNVKPGFDADFGKHSCASGCAQLVFAVVKGNRFALLPVDSHLPACLQQ